MELIQLWLSVEGEALDYPGIPSRSSIDLENGRLTAEFPPEAVEIDAIAAGKKFRIDRDFELPVLLHCTPRGETAQLIDDSGLTGYEIPRQRQETTQSFAWLESPLPAKKKKDGEDDEPTHAVSQLAIVNEITGDGQVVINRGGAIQVSRDLIGKTIRARIPAFCDRRVVRLLEPLGELFLHAVVREKGATQYFQVECAPARATSFSTAGYRRLEATFDADQVERRDL